MDNVKKVSSWWRRELQIKKNAKLEETIWRWDGSYGCKEREKGMEGGREGWIGMEIDVDVCVSIYIYLYIFPISTIWITSSTQF